MNAIKNIHETIESKSYEIVVSIDEDDTSMAGTPLLERVTYFKGKSFSKIEAVNRNINELTYEWDLLIVMSDDMFFKVKGWDRIIIEKIKGKWGDSLDFFAHFNDGHVKHRMATMSIMGREYYERFFYVYAPCYRSFYSDAEAMFVAMLLDRYCYFDDHLFEHRHPANTVDTKNDGTYVFNERWGNHDYETYLRRKQNLFYVHNSNTIPFNPNGSWEGDLRQ
jgi:hypothetical protein